MSTIEDPSVTVARLLRSQLRVVLDNGGLASVNVSAEYPGSDAFKLGDGQVTVGLADCSDQKLDLTGKIRRRTAAVRVNAWATDTPAAAESGKSLRGKIVEEINRIIRQNRTTPNQTTYTFVNQPAGGEGCRAFGGAAESAPTEKWTELSDMDYAKLWYRDDSRCQISSSQSGESAVLLVGFKVESCPGVVAEAAFCFEGYGVAPGGDGVAVKAWNSAQQAWHNMQSNSEGQTDEALTLTLSSGFSDFIDADGYLWFLAKTLGTSDDETEAVLTCDYVSCRVTVKGITYCDIAGYRRLDRTDTKPPIYRTEFSVKSWFIENIGV
ncbi:MAG: hypothetical protein NWE93_00735 [Candidatus Bathyarchaeota archaeon]|nr:hypothetical protein [Candidatus Bathyarchaeota archaeon]